MGQSPPLYHTNFYSSVCENCRLTMGSSVKATGKLVKSLGKGQAFEFNARNVEILGTCDPEVRKIGAISGLNANLTKFLGVSHTKEESHDGISSRARKFSFSYRRSCADDQIKTRVQACI
jgi:hypothetical protein